MLKIEIEIHHPVALVVTLAVTVGVVATLQWYITGETMTADAVGGVMEVQQIQESEKTLKRLRIEQAVLLRQEEILRYQLRVLEEQLHRGAASEEQYRSTKDALIRLLDNRRQAEDAIRTALLQRWEAERRAVAVSVTDGAPLHLAWPVDASLGISATFRDESYEERFGLPHDAIDIPVLQGTVIHAPADGVIESVVDNGYGYSYLVIRHSGGSTLYGHVSEFLVSEGQEVRRGDAVARSGGMPGTPGAGLLTTGPHLHFEVIRDGVHVDPMDYLPSL